LVPREPWTYVDSPDDVINLLIRERADLNPLYVAETPLQMAVRNFSDSDTIKIMLMAGAKVNAVGEDEAVAVKIRTEHQVLDKEDIDEMVNERGLEHYYDTSLKIVMKKIESSPSDKSELIELKDLLESYGGKALHLFPFRNLPGYVEADMRALRIDTKDGTKTPLNVNDHGEVARDVPQAFIPQSRRLPAPWIAGSDYICVWPNCSPRAAFKNAKELGCHIQTSHDMNRLEHSEVAKTAITSTFHYPPPSENPTTHWTERFRGKNF
jgi:hypothetical protein